MKWTRAIRGKCCSRPRRFGTPIALQACAFILILATAGTATAQQSAQQPRPYLQQPEKRLDAIQLDRRRSNAAPVPMPKMARPEIRADTKPLFKLARVIVEGANVIPTREIAETYRSDIGKTVSQADLVEIATRIGNLYRDAGYHLSRAIVPPQDVKDGLVRINVIEGRIAAIVLKGEGAERFGVRSMLRPVIDEHPSRLKTLERQLMLVNDSAGIRITDTALEEIGTASGNFRLIVSIESWRIYAALSLDNMGLASVGPLEAFSTTAFNSYFLTGDALAVNLSTVPDAPRDLAFGRLSYDVPVGVDGARLGATALYSDTWPNDERRRFDTHTQMETYELKGSIIPLETRRSSLWLTATAGWSDVSERDSFGVNYIDHIRTASLTADYKLQDNLDGWNYVTAIWRQGLDVLGATDRGDPWSSRYAASGAFSAFDLSFTRYQRLSDIWSLKLSASGQWASTPLLTSQQFYLGDAAYGPSYYSGDNGAAGLLELRFDQTLPYDLLKGYQLYGFVDRGAVWNTDSPGDVFSLSSVGAGVRLFLLGQMQASVGFAVPLHFKTTANDVSDTRVLFSLSSSLKACPDRAQLRCI